MFEKEKSVKIEIRLRESEKLEIKRMAAEKEKSITDFIKHLISIEYDKKTIQKCQDKISKKDVKLKNEYLLDTVLGMLDVLEETVKDSDSKSIIKSIRNIKNRLKVKFDKK